MDLQPKGQSKVLRFGWPPLSTAGHWCHRHVGVNLCGHTGVIGGYLLSVHSKKPSRDFKVIPIAAAVEKTPMNFMTAPILRHLLSYSPQTAAFFERYSLERYLEGTWG